MPLFVCRITVAPTTTSSPSLHSQQKLLNRPKLPCPSPTTHPLQKSLHPRENESLTISTHTMCLVGEAHHGISLEYVPKNHLSLPLVNKITSVLVKTKHLNSAAAISPSKSTDHELQSSVTIHTQ